MLVYHVQKSMRLGVHLGQNLQGFQNLEGF